MQAANHGAHRFPAGQMPDVIQRIDHAGMSAAQEQDHTAAKVNHQRLIILERVWMRASSIQKESASSVFISVCAGNFSRGKDAFDYLGAARRFNESTRAATNGLNHAIAHADGA